jgi:hypothetical protein
MKNNDQDLFGFWLLMYVYAQARYIEELEIRLAIAEAGR